MVSKDYETERARALQQIRFIIKSQSPEDAVESIQRMLGAALDKIAEQGRDLASARAGMFPVGKFWTNGQGKWAQSTPESQVKGPTQTLYAYQVPHHPV